MVDLSTPTRRRVVVSSEASRLRAAQVQVMMYSHLSHKIYVNVDSASSPRAERPVLLVSDLGWSREQAAAVRAQLAAFEVGWDSPEMDAYDAL